MLKYKVFHTLLAASAAVLLSACGGGGSSHSSSGGGQSATEPTTLADYQVRLVGPGGHSNGNYGRTNALHAGGRLVVRLEELAGMEDVVFYVKEIKGGDSVNSIAQETYVTVGLLEGDEANFKELVESAADYAAKAENGFRGVSAGQITSNVRVDIRVDSVTKL
jgi:hypothetical protein